MRVSRWSYEPRRLGYPPHDDDREFSEALKEYRIDRVLTKLARFTVVRGLEADRYEEAGNSLLMLHLAGVRPVGDGRLREYLDQYQVAAAGGIFNNCFAIADDSCRAGRASYQLRAYGTNDDFIGWASHCISYDAQRDGSAIAYDLTAGKNLFENCGDFQVLGLHMTDFCELQSAAGWLYGGKWDLFGDDK